MEEFIAAIILEEDDSLVYCMSRGTTDFFSKRNLKDITSVCRKIVDRLPDEIQGIFFQSFKRNFPVY
jgi:hypothetical protein